MRIIFLLALTLSACTTTPEVRVEKPPPPPEITTPAAPNLQGLPPAEQVRGIQLYILQLRQALQEALNALDAYR